jgi:hypothetical protein
MCNLPRRLRREKKHLKGTWIKYALFENAAISNFCLTVGQQLAVAFSWWKRERIGSQYRLSFCYKFINQNRDLKQN